MKKALILPAIMIMTSIIIFYSCAGSPSAEEQIKTEREIRGYERMKSDLTLKDKDDLEKSGIYFDGKLFYVVISLSDSGTDRYPEWACERFLNSLYAYNAVIHGMVSENEYYEFALKFSVEGITEKEYENITRVVIRERDVIAFLDSYKDGE